MNNDKGKTWQSMSHVSQELTAEAAEKTKDEAITRTKAQLETERIQKERNQMPPTIHDTPDVLAAKIAVGLDDKANMGVARGAYLTDFFKTLEDQREEYEWELSMGDDL